MLKRQPRALVILAALLAVGCSGATTGCGDSCSSPPPPPPSDPVLPPNQRVVGMGAGFSSTCALTELGKLFCWGENRFGELGDSTTTPRPLPTAVHTSQQFVSVIGTVGTSRSCAINTRGDAFCWGYNLNGELGDGTQIDRYVPTPVTGGLKFRMLATSFHSCGVTVDDTAYCWGVPLAGALGRGDVDGNTTIPLPVTGDLKFQTVVTGLEFSCGLALNGAAYCWGLITGTGVEQTSNVPVAVTGGLAFSALTAGQGYVCGLTSAGALYCWGQLDGPFAPTVYAPRLVSGLPPLTAASAGFYHMCALAAGGVAYCWLIEATPSKVSTELRFAGLAGGHDDSCGFTVGGAAYCWSLLQIGTTVPARVPSFPSD